LKYDFSVNYWVYRNSDLDLALKQAWKRNGRKNLEIGKSQTLMVANNKEAFTLPIHPCMDG
jgi:hypothetical protein